MFQTEIIHFLQSFSNDVLTFIFRLFSDIGHTTAIMPVVVAITVGLHFRIGVVMMHTALWTGVTTTYLKEVFALPRPVNVDSSLQMLTTGSPNPSPFNSMGAGGFFEALPGHVVEYLRSHRIDSFGLPSGHTSTAVAVWGSIYLYFARWTELIPALAGKKNRGGKEKKQWGHMVAIVFLITIPFSRMYLGRHFLGDVLGGYLLGFAILLLFYQGVYRNEPLMAFLFEKALYLRLNWKTMVTAIYFVVTPFLLLLLPLDPWQPKMKITLTALLLGMNLAFLLLWKRGLPKETGTFRQRALRTILGLFFFAAMVALFKGIALLLFTNEPMTARFIRLTFTFFSSFWGGIETAIKLKLMER